MDLDEDCWLMLDWLTLGPLQLNFNQLWGLSSQYRVTYKSMHSVFEESSENVLPSILSELQIEMNNYAFGDYHQVVMHKFDCNTAVPLNPLEDRPGSEMPTIVLAIGENRHKGDALGRILKCGSDEEVR